MARAAYYRTFRLTEVQQTFYQPPRVQTLAAWRREAPREFEFSLKAWQLITPHAAQSYVSPTEKTDPGGTQGPIWAIPSDR